MFNDLKSFVGFVFFKILFFLHFLSYTGTSLDKEFIGKFATFLLLKFKTKFFELVVFPIKEKSKPHLLKIFFAFSSFPELSINSILS